MSEGISTETSVATKLCHLVKRPDFDGYGFNLHAEKSKPGQYVGKIDAGSPAEEAGLREGDRIIEVNGVPIGNETHKEVVQRIKAISCEVRLLLISADYKSNQEKGFNNLKSDEILSTKSNITSINMTSTKRVSNGSQNSEVMPNENAINSKQLQQVHSQPTTNVKLSPELPLEPVSQSAVRNHGNGRANLMLPQTAAEMRARLLSKKKVDPKNENVDFKTKFEIVQKL